MLPTPIVRSRSPQKELVRSPFEPPSVGRPLGNSLNHGGTGQNVLYFGGNVTFATHRHVGVDGDDIYLNKRNRVAAGVNRWDTVLGASAAHPWDD